MCNSSPNLGRHLFKNMGAPWRPLAALGRSGALQAPLAPCLARSLEHLGPLLAVILSLLVLTPLVLSPLVLCLLALSPLILFLWALLP